MITVRKEKLIIEVKHACPKEFSRDLKEALIGAMQYQSQEFENHEKLYFINFTLLELLKNLES